MDGIGGGDDSRQQSTPMGPELMVSGRVLLLTAALFLAVFVAWLVLI
ncbi:hypothetical protein [Halosimplex salinum]|nr:hypothetical protein [Halosimplex salinum]